MTSCPKCGITQNLATQYCSACGTMVNSFTVSSKTDLHDWEQRQGSLFGPFFALLSSLIKRPSSVFSKINVRSDAGSASIFYAILVLLCTPAILWVQRNSYTDNAQISSSIIMLIMVLQPLLTVLLGLVDLAISSALFQILFSITGVKKASYKETYTALAYSTAPTILFLIPIPILPAFIASIWTFVLKVISMAEINNVGKGKMFLIQFIPLVILSTILFFFLFILVMIIAALGISMADSFPIQEYLDLIR